MTFQSPIKSESSDRSQSSLVQSSFNSAKSTPRHKVYEISDSKKWRGIDLENSLEQPGPKINHPNQLYCKFYRLIKIYLNTYEVRTQVTIFNTLDSVITNLLQLRVIITNFESFIFFLFPWYLLTVNLILINIFHIIKPFLFTDYSSSLREDSSEPNIKVVNLLRREVLLFWRNKVKTFFNWCFHLNLLQTLINLKFHSDVNLIFPQFHKIL